jgi:hypothetical protein
MPESRVGSLTYWVAPNPEQVLHASLYRFTAQRVTKPLAAARKVSTTGSCMYPTFTNSQEKNLA